MWYHIKVTFCWSTYYIATVYEKYEIYNALLPACEKVLLVLLCVRNEENIGWQNYDKKSGLTREAIKLETLGPTSDAAHQHILYVHYSVREWKEDNILDILD